MSMMRQAACWRRQGRTAPWKRLMPMTDGGTASKRRTRKDTIPTTVMTWRDALYGNSCPWEGAGTISTTA